ncbi:hypothetical protein ACFQD1_36165, partial [Nonomuraea thailandensis]
MTKGVDDRFVKTDLNTLLTALYVRIDDWLGHRPRPGRRPKPTDAELLTLAVAQVLLDIRSEARWLRYVPEHLPGAFPYLPGQSGYNKRLHKALPLFKRAIRTLAQDTDLWLDPLWVVDSTPLECGRSRPTTQRSDLAGWAGYGYCRSHSRWFWGLRLHLICTPAGLPITWALAIPKIDERQVLMAICEHDPALLLDRSGLLMNWTPSSPNAAYDCYARPTATAHPAPASTCSNRSASSSSPSTTPSRTLLADSVVKPPVRGRVWRSG